VEQAVQLHPQQVGCHPGAGPNLEDVVTQLGVGQRVRKDKVAQRIAPTIAAAELEVFWVHPWRR